MILLSRTGKTCISIQILQQINSTKNLLYFYILPFYVTGVICILYFYAMLSLKFIAIRHYFLNVPATAEQFLPVPSPKLFLHYISLPYFFITWFLSLILLKITQAFKDGYSLCYFISLITFFPNNLSFVFFTIFTYSLSSFSFSLVKSLDSCLFFFPSYYKYNFTIIVSFLISY